MSSADSAGPNAPVHVAETQRRGVPDVLRGIALFGVLLVNLRAFRVTACCRRMRPRRGRPGRCAGSHARSTGRRKGGDPVRVAVRRPLRPADAARRRGSRCGPALRAAFVAVIDHWAGPRAVVVGRHTALLRCARVAAGVAAKCETAHTCLGRRADRAVCAAAVLRPMLPALLPLPADQASAAALASFPATT